MLPALGFIDIGIVGIFAGRFFKKFAEQQQQKLEERKKQKEQEK